MYRQYVTEQLRMIPQGKSFRESWHDMVESALVAPDTRTADEIALDVITRAGLTWKGGE